MSQKPAIRNSQLPTIKLLLIEDNPGDTRLIREMLAEVQQTLSFDLVCADRLSTGLEHLAEGGIHVVLLDLGLPDSQGLDTFIRVHDQAPDVPIVVLTGLDDEVLAVKAVQAGAQDYLVKGQVHAILLARAASYAIERKRAEVELATLYEVACGISAAMELPELLQRIYEGCRQMVPVETFYLALYDRQSQTVEAPMYVENGENLGPLRFPLAEAGLAGHIIRTGQAVCLGDFDTEVEHLAIEPRLVGARTHSFSYLGVPLMRGEQVVGVMAVQHPEPWAYGPSQQDILERLAAQVAVALENARLFDETHRRAEGLEALATVSSALRKAPTRAKMLPVILDQLLGLLNADGVALAMRDPASSETVIELARGKWIYRSGERLPPGEGVSGHVIATGQPYLSNDMQVDPFLGRPDPSATLRRQFREWASGGRIVRMRTIRHSRQLTRSATMPNPPPAADSVSGPALCSKLLAVTCVPLVAQGQTIGALLVGRKTDIAEEEVRLLTAIGDMAANAIHRVTLHEQTQQRLQRLTALRNVDMAITASVDLRVTLNVLLDQVTAQLGVDAADVLLLNPQTQTLEYAAGRGFRSTAIQRSRVRLGEGLAGRAALERKTISDCGSRIAEGQKSEVRIPHSAIEEGFTAYVGVPLIAKGRIRGVLEVFHCAPLDPDPEWRDFLEALAGQAAIAIDNATLFDDLQRSNVELTLAYDTTLEGWAQALEMRDVETAGHTRRVTETTLCLARAMGMSEADTSTPISSRRDGIGLSTSLVHVRRGALLHDIGKMGIPDSILHKPGPLSEEEWDIMHQHPVYAYELLSPITHLRPALDIPYYHHEKWDSTGYPRGLKGEEIPLAARVFAVVDVWDALRSERPYRGAWPEERVVGYIREQAGTHFDPQVVETFLQMEVAIPRNLR